MHWTSLPTIRVATHACPHHLDELIALALLRRWSAARGVTLELAFLPREKIATAAASNDMLVDIGEQFDPAQGRFDHHQGGDSARGRSSAGLIFDALFASDPAAAYLRPVMALVDQIDAGNRPPRVGQSREQQRADNLLSLSTLLKGLGGFEPNEQRSHRCLEVVQALVDRWFDQADQYLSAGAILGRGRAIAGGIFLAPGDEYSPALEEAARESTARFIGYQQKPDRFTLTAVRDDDGRNRVVFPNALPGASFVHANGFFAVFPNAHTAEIALAEMATS